MAVIELAEAVLASPDCSTDPGCVWVALFALICADDLTAASRHCDRLDELPGWARSEPHDQVLPLARARIDLSYGRPVDAVEGLTALLMRVPAGPMAGIWIAWLVEAHLQSGDVDRGRRMLHDHEVDNQAHRDPLTRAHLIAAHGAAHLAAGNHGQAIEQYRACGRVLTSLGIDNPAIAPWRAGAAAGAIAMGRSDLAAALAEDDLAMARRWGAPRGVGRALRAFALARRDGNSIGLLSEAAELFDLAHAPLEMMETLYDVGILHLEQNDLVAGRTALRTVGTLARGHDNDLWWQRSITALGLLEPPAEQAQLTRQELRTAQLARIGYSNWQIAESMSVRIRTVEFHLSGVYRKLGISGRRELGTALPTVAP